MKFMKLGTRPDTFYTEEATRTVISDAPSDISIQINNVSCLLHKLQLLSKCGLLQRLCSNVDEDSAYVSLKLPDIPGGENAFELCAKFCYGITINLSAHNFVSAFCAAKFLIMTDAVAKGNLILKLEAFFNSCILEGWKDSIVTLQTTGALPEWSENLGIIRRCIDSIVEKILSPPAKVTWSYTYTRAGYAQKHNQAAPKDWWTEDITELDIDLFRCIVTAVRSTNMVSPQLIGEALHVYASRWLLDKTRSRTAECSATKTNESLDTKQRILETIVSMVPADRDSVSIRFLLRLLSLANKIGVAPITKTELLRRCGLQFDEATLNDLLQLPSPSFNDHHFYNVDLVRAALDSFLMQWRRRLTGEQRQSVRVIRKVGKLIDSYLQVIAGGVNMPVEKVVSLAEALPDIARNEHDELYKAINIYLKEHPDMTKSEKKQLCRILDCQKLSPQVCAHAVRSELLPLRTVVQLLFFEQERGARATGHQPMHISRDDLGKLKSVPDKQHTKAAQGIRRSTTPTPGPHKLSKSVGKPIVEAEKIMTRKGAAEMMLELEGEIKEEGFATSELDPKKIIQRRTRSSNHGLSQGRER